uniref:N-lysine methyltransferase SETD6 n=1 Tax=Leptobrachium leishanense TaxID=445787 RepID=A0A8C5QI96_9ANUR
MESGSKKRRVDEDALGGPPAVTQFLAWCDHVGVKLNPKVAITSDGSVAQYGLIARDHLMDGEVLFSVPRSALLSQDTSRIQDLLDRERDRLESPSGWVPLLLALLYEATDGTSPWAPYFGLWPGLDPPDLPMFWSEEERMRLLRGTGVAEAVNKDLQNMEREYNTIVLPFIQRHPKTFSAEKHTLDLYKRLVAFVMAYSFQEPVDEEEDCGKRDPPPMMVPVADLLNHVTENNARLEFTPDYLRMVATRPVQPGQEIFNTYGQMANWQLLHMYGFTEPHPHNASETADIRMWTLHRAALQGASSAREQTQVQERWKFLCRLEMVAEDGVLVFGREEVMTDDELRTCLKVLCMSEEKFAEYKENEGWEEDDEEEEPPLMLEDLSDLPARWRKLLHTSTALTLATYTDGLETEQAALTDTAAYVALSARERHAMQVRYGQKLILQRILDVAKD